MSGPLADYYVLAPDRSAVGAQRFLQAFAPGCSPAWDTSDPSDVLGVSADLPLRDLLLFLERHPASAYSMYFRSPSGDSFAILSYCSDGSLILGMSVEESEALAGNLLGQMEAYAGSKGYATEEEAPLGSSREFLARVGA